MYLHLGQNVVVPLRDVVGIFDLDNTTGSVITRRFLERAEREGRAITVGEELPKSFILCDGENAGRVYISQISSSTLLRRAQGHGLDG